LDNFFFAGDFDQILKMKEVLSLVSLLVLFWAIFIFVVVYKEDKSTPLDRMVVYWMIAELLHKILMPFRILADVFSKIVAITTRPILWLMDMWITFCIKIVFS
jgi:hypothetical protein